jgi:DNA-binding transcriptional LysR family regulator
MSTRADIPTEQLRALVAVVDFGSFTKAARFLGLSQPAVSVQIKRLQELLEVELFDKGGAGVRLTRQGELVVNYARRMLAINDQLLHLVKPIHPIQALRFGIPSDLVESMLPGALITLRKQFPAIKFHIRQDVSENLLRDLRQGELDLVVALTLTEPALEARHYWREEVVWVGAADAAPDPSRPVPLVAYTDNCIYARLASSTLNRAGLDYEIVFTGTGIVSLAAAVSAGLGYLVLARRVVPAELAICDGALPHLPDLICGVYLRDGPESEVLGRVADEMASLIRPPVLPASP